MKSESREYYHARERAERLAAENAACTQARKAHDEMARAYARLAEDAQPDSAQLDAERPAA